VQPFFMQLARQFKKNWRSLNFQTVLKEIE
jgi:hypothetical protein